MSAAQETWVMVVYPSTDPVELLAHALDGKPREEAYLLAFDPDGSRGLGDIVLTTDIARAKRFPGFLAVMEEWRRSSTVVPLRDDGKPNRPLTAFSIHPKKVA
jgi:hypothetical protein